MARITVSWQLLLLSCIILFAEASCIATGDEGGFTEDYSKVTGIIIPGFACSQLRAFSILDCPYSPLNFEPLDLVWLDSTKAFSSVNCWQKCMKLDPNNQTDHPECRVRPATGLSAISILDPGYITGPLTSVWKEWIRWCIEFGVEADAIIAVPYDWRLSPSKLEERDLYFHKLKITFETTLKQRGGPSVVFAHSLGNNVFRYFLEWLKLEIAPKHYIEWLDQHIHAYFALGAPLLGATETLEAIFSGFTTALPVSEGIAREMFNSFGSSLWMMPFSKHCRSVQPYWKHMSGQDKNSNKFYHCDEQEFLQNFSGWPTHVVNIEVPSIRGMDAYPSIMKMVHSNISSLKFGLPTQLSFSAHEIADGTFFKAIEDYDPESKRLLNQLEKWYHHDPVLNPLTPWGRPPIKNIFCIYGVDLKTKVGFYFAPSGKRYPYNWSIRDVTYEKGGSLISRSGKVIKGNPGVASGDETVPYHSLSWCKNWLGPMVNITRAPQSEHDGSDVQAELNVKHLHGEDIVPNMKRSPRVKYITYYEDSESFPGMRTAVWELDKVNHRDVVRSPIVMREMWLQIWHEFLPKTKSPFVTKAKRGPLRDADCYFDFGKARCAWPEFCEFRYVFGDIFPLSCRLKNSSLLVLSRYYL